MGTSRVQNRMSKLRAAVAAGRLCGYAVKKDAKGTIAAMVLVKGRAAARVTRWNRLFSVSNVTYLVIPKFILTAVGKQGT